MIAAWTDVAGDVDFEGGKSFVHSGQNGAKYFVYYGYMKLSDMMILYVQQKQSRRPKAVE